MTSRRFDSAPRAIARLQRRLDDLWKLASRKGHGHDSLPLGVLGYAEVTSDQTGITSEVDLTGLSVTVNVAANRRIRITGYVLWSTNTADDGIRLHIKESTTQLTRADAATPFIGGLMSLVASRVLTPSAGSHTYKLSARNLSTGTVTINASGSGAWIPYILVEDIGPV